MLKRVYTFMLVLVSITGAMGQLAPDATTKYDQGTSAKTDQNDIVVGTRRIIVTVTHPNWHSGKAVLVIMHSPLSGYFLWSLIPIPRNQPAAVDRYGNFKGLCVTSDKFVQFTYAHPYLVIKESQEKASSLDEAESRSLQAAGLRLPTLLAWNQPDLVSVNVAKLLPKDFVAPPFQANGGPFKLVGASQKGNTWEVIIQGQWQEKITLDQKYRVTSLVRLN